MKTTATARGRIVIPVAIRRRLGIKDGTRIHVDVDEESKRIVLTPITGAFVLSLRGKYQGHGLLKALSEERRREREP